MQFKLGVSPCTRGCSDTLESNQPVCRASVCVGGTGEGGRGGGLIVEMCGCGYVGGYAFVSVSVGMRV